MTDKKRIGYLAENLRRTMQIQGVTQEQLESSSGVPQSTISRVLGGMNDPAVTVVFHLAHALGTSLDLLLSPPAKKN